MGLTGDFGRLAGTIRALQKLATVPAAVSKLAAEEIKAEIDASFTQNRDPYGKTWAPHAPATVERWGKHPLLRLTGAGKSQIQVKPLPGGGIAVTSPSQGLRFAQGGTRHEPARRYLPTDTMPARWKAALERAARRKIEEALSGSR